MSAGRNYISMWSRKRGIEHIDREAVRRFVYDALTANQRVTDVDEAIGHLEKAISKVQAGADHEPLLGYLQNMMRLLFDAQHAALLLGGMFAAVTAGDKGPDSAEKIFRKMTGARKQRRGRFDPYRHRKHKQLSDIILKLDRDEISYTEAVQMISKVGLTNERTAQKWIEEIRVNRKSTDRFLRDLEATSAEDQSDEKWP